VYCPNSVHDDIFLKLLCIFCKSREDMYHISALFYIMCTVYVHARVGSLLSV
jgi:hypothetical protein